METRNNYNFFIFIRIVFFLFINVFMFFWASLFDVFVNFEEFKELLVNVFNLSYGESKYRDIIMFRIFILFVVFVNFFYAYVVLSAKYFFYPTARTLILEKYIYGVSTNNLEKKSEVVREKIKFLVSSDGTFLVFGSNMLQFFNVYDGLDESSKNNLSLKIKYFFEKIPEPEKASELVMSYSTELFFYDIFYTYYIVSLTVANYEIISRPTFFIRGYTAGTVIYNNYESKSFVKY